MVDCVCFWKFRFFNFTHTSVFRISCWKKRKVSKPRKETTKIHNNNDGDSSVRQPGVICINFHFENIPRPFETKKKKRGRSKIQISLWSFTTTIFFFTPPPSCYKKKNKQQVFSSEGKNGFSIDCSYLSMVFIVADFLHFHHDQRGCTDITR